MRERERERERERTIHSLTTHRYSKHKRISIRPHLHMLAIL